MNTQAGWVGCVVAVALVSASCTVSGQAVSAQDRHARVDELVVANHILANEGVLDGYGHVSIRDPQNHSRFLLARAGAPALVGAADVIEYDLDSRPSSQASATGYTERFIHGEIYRTRPDVMAVVHCHCPEVIPFGATAVPMRPMYHMAYFVGEGVPVFDIRDAAGATDMLISTPALGRALARTLGGASAVLMRGHGAAVVATALHDVVGKTYYLNLNARLQWQAMQMGAAKVTYLDADEAKKAAQNFERSWDTWKSKLPRQ